MTENAQALSGDDFITALNGEVQETTTNEIIATFISNYTKMLSSKLVEAQSSQSELSITADEVTSLLVSAAREHGVNEGSAVIQDLMDDPAISGAFSNLIDNPGASVEQDEDSLLKDFDQRFAEVTSGQQDIPAFENALTLQDQTIATELNKTIESFGLKDVGSLGGSLATTLGPGLKKELGSLKEGLSEIKYHNIVGTLQDSQLDKAIRDAAFDDLLDNHKSFNELLSVVKNKSISLEYREAAFSKLQDEFGQVDGSGKYRIGENLDVMGLGIGIGAGVAGAGAGIYGLVTDSQAAASLSGNDKAKAALSAAGGGVSALQAIYTMTDTIATQIAKRAGSEGVQQVASFFSKSATKAAGGLTTGSSKFTKAASGFAIGIGSALAVAAGITSLTMSAISADEARRSGNHGRAAVYGVMAALDGVGIVLDVVSLVADFLPPIGTVVSAVLDLVNLALAGISTVLGAFADFIDTRTDEEKTRHALDSLVESPEFQSHIDDLAGSFADQGYDVLEYIVDADSTGVTEGDVDGGTIDRTLTRYLTDKAEELRQDDDARLAIIDASSIGRILSGGNKDDYIDGGAGNDTIRGGKGDDILLGGTGNDSLFGEEGDDRLVAGAGVNRLYGGPGDDKLKATLGINDLADGGPGDDALILAELEAAVYSRPEQAILLIEYPLSDTTSFHGYPARSDDLNGSVSQWFPHASAEINLETGKGYLHITPDYNQLVQTGAIDDYYFTGFTGPFDAPDAVDAIFRDLLGGDISSWQRVGAPDAEQLRILYTDSANGKLSWVTDGESIFVAHRIVSYSFHGGKRVDTSWRKSPVSASELLAHYNDDTIENGRHDAYENSVTLSAAELLGMIIHSGYVGTDIKNIETVIAGYLDPEGSAVAANPFNDTVKITGSHRGEVFQVDINSTVSAGGGDDTVVLNSNTRSEFDASRFKVDGGQGVDTLEFAGTSKANGVTVTILDDDADVSGLSSYIRGFENILGTAGDDNITGNSSDNLLIGRDGSDHLVGGAGSDVLSGGDGYDILDGGEGIDTVNYSLDDGDSDSLLKINLLTGETLYKSQIDGNWHREDILRNIENVFGSSNDDIIIGNERENTLAGAAGNDTIEGGEGNDILLGGTGDDVLLGDSSTGENAGNDFLSGGLGFDIMDGEGGNDTVSYSLDKDDADRRHKIYLSDTNVTSTQADSGNGWEDEDILKNIENLVGGNKDDILHGNSQANILNGAGGNDDINGKAGNDTILFSSGSDTLDGGTGVDTLEYSTKGDAFFADLEAGHAENGAASENHYRLNGFNIGTLHVGYVVSVELTLPSGEVLSVSHTITDPERVYPYRWVADLHARINNDPLVSAYLQGTAKGSNYLEIATVFDTAGDAGLAFKVHGHDRSDVYSLNSDSKRVGEAGESSLQNIENIDASKADRHVNLKGNSKDNTLKAGSGHDILYGRDGSDQLFGGAGDDRLYGGNQDDLLLGGDGNDLLEGGANNDILSGGEGDDHLKGGSGIDILMANGGTDTLEGGSGSDTYVIFENSRDSVIRDTEGRHTLQFKGLEKDQVKLAFELSDGRSLLSFSNSDGARLVSFDLGAEQVLGDLYIAVQAGQEQLEAKITELFGDFAALRFGETQITQGSLTSYFADAAGQPGALSGEVLGPRANNHYFDADGVDSHWTFGSGIDRISDNGGDDTLTLHGMEKVLFHRVQGSDDLQIFNLEGGSGNLLLRGEDLTIKNYFVANGDSGRLNGHIETIEVNGQSYRLTEVEKLVQATAQFMADNGISSVLSSDASQYIDHLSALTAPALS